MLQAYKACASIAMVIITFGLCIMVGLEIYDYYLKRFKK